MRRTVFEFLVAALFITSQFACWALTGSQASSFSATELRAVNYALIAAMLVGILLQAVFLRIRWRENDKRRRAGNVLVTLASPWPDYPIATLATGIVALFALMWYRLGVVPLFGPILALFVAVTIGFQLLIRELLEAPHLEIREGGVLHEVRFRAWNELRAYVWKRVDRDTFSLVILRSMDDSRIAVGVPQHEAGMIDDALRRRLSLESTGFRKTASRHGARSRFQRRRLTRARASSRSRTHRFDKFRTTTFWRPRVAL